MKPGWQTSELWLVAGTVVASLLNKKLGLDLDSGTLAGIFGTVATYVAGRSWSKGKH